MVKVRVDFSEAAEGGAFNPRNVEEGDYKAKITKCEVGVSKKSDTKQLIFTMEVPSIRGATYPFYCPLEGRGTWKTRTIVEAIGKKAPKGAASLDTSLFIGKFVGVELVDDEYEGRVKSVINQVFSVSELNASDDAEPEDEDELEEEEAPAPKKKAPAKKVPAKKKKPVEDDEDDEDLEEMDLEDI